MRKRSLRDNKPSNKLVGFVIVVIVAFLAVFLNMQSKTIKAGNDKKQADIEELREEIKEEQNRTEELDEYEKRTHTKQFYEEYARNMWGLCYPDEIIFKSED